MSTLSREDLKRALKQNRLEPLYLLFGAEDYLRDRAARAISEAVLKDAPLREFNESSYSLLSTDVQQAIAAAEQLPMMAPRRVVRMTDFGKLREADEEALMRYVTRPAESSVVIFIADDLDKRRKLSKTLLDVCTGVEFAPLAEGELAAWAKGRLKELKVETDERTLHQLIALVGSNVRTLSNELEKLATASLGHGRITMEMVDGLVGRSRELSNFELTDHLITRNRQRALQTLRRLLDDGVEPLMLIGLLASNYHRLCPVIQQPLQSLQSPLAIARNQVIRQLEIREFARAPDERVNHLHRDEPVAERSGSQLFKLVRERAHVRADERHNLMQSPLVRLHLQISQPLLSPLRKLRIRERRELDRHANFEQGLAELTPFIKVVGDENHD
ncbi:MAG TPA: DNA polymerase III subunit delta [Pyrinomonadaceae bacterium]|nr:DNA polymerase III subunit delta [Pyrinomonadaceae bacterium]